MNPSSRAHGGGGQYPTIALPGRYHTRRTASALYGDVTWNSSPTLRFPSPSTSKKERSAFPDPFVSGWMNANNLVAFAYVALYSDRGRTRETAETTTRVPPVVFKTNAICGSVGRFSCTSPRGMNTIASIRRRMTPERRDARRSLRAAGGGDVRRLNRGFLRTGRGICTASLHVDRGPTGDREAGAPLRIVEVLRVRLEDLDAGFELLLEEPLRSDQVRPLVERLCAGRPLLGPEAGDLRDDPLREGLDLPATGPQVRVLHQGLHRGPEVEGLPPAEPGEPRDRPPHPRGGGVQDDPRRTEGRHLQDLADCRSKTPCRRTARYSIASIAPRLAATARPRVERNHRSIGSAFVLVLWRAVENRTQSWRRTPIDSTKSGSKLGSSRPSPA